MTFTIDFDPEPADLDADTLKANLTVTGGTLGTVSRETEGSNARWSVTVTPSPGDDLVIALAETTDCEAANAICTGFGGRLETVPSQATIPYQAGYSGQRGKRPGGAGRRHLPRCSGEPRRQHGGELRDRLRAPSPRTSTATR